MTDYLTIEPDTIRIFDLSVETKNINRALLSAEIEVSAISVIAGSLEDYFKTITGGHGIA
jgi:hypothetical protein